MNDTELEKRKGRAANETLVIAPTEGGFRVYNPAAIANLYMVSGIPESPNCNCPDFQTHQDDPTWRCKHILAVVNQLEKKPETQSAAAEPRESKEREAIRSADQLPDKKKTKAARNVHSQMVIKRSVSPDGYIDSLSVEFLKSIDKESDEDIKRQAEKTLLLQSEIVKSFLQANGNGKTGNHMRERGSGNRPSNGASQSNANSAGQDRANGQSANSDSSVPAHLLNIAGMDTKAGWTTFINVQVNGIKAKLFGEKRELAKHITDAGFANLANRIHQGMLLNLPCRVITKRSQDGKYLNIEKVLPVKPLASNGRLGQ